VSFQTASTPADCRGFEKLTFAGFRGGAQ